MIHKTFSHELAKCYECGKWLIYTPAVSGFPTHCPHCGVSSTESATPQQRSAMDQQKQQNQKRQNPGFMFQNLNFGR